MKILATLSLILALFSPNVNAADKSGVYEGMRVVLTDKPCTNAAVKSFLKPEFHNKFKAGHVFPGAGPDKIQLCYTDNKDILDKVELDPKEYYMVVDENFGFGGLPKNIFKNGVNRNKTF